MVNIQDLTLVAAQFGQTGEDIPADVNGDGVVDIKDLVLVAAAFGEAAAAPMFAQAESLELGKGIETGRKHQDREGHPCPDTPPVGAVGNRAYRLVTVGRGPVPRHASVCSLSEARSLQ